MSSRKLSDPAHAGETPPDVRSTELRAAGEALVNWYELRARALPWRQRTDPYAVWISEIMLQQTSVEVVKERYESFLAAFPDVDALAAADESEILEVVQGLGYYRRFRALGAAARRVRDEFGGVLPREVQELRSLPGVGRYTAGAIASIAFGEPVPAVDGNVARVVARLACIDADVRTGPGLRLIEEVVRTMMPADRASEFNQGLFDLGSSICTPRAPSCEECPVAGVCRARLSGRQRDFPRSVRKAEPLDVAVLVAAVNRGDEVLLVRRPADAQRMAGFWELPEVWVQRHGASEVGVSPVVLADHVRGVIGAPVSIDERPCVRARHVITRHRLDCRLHCGRLRSEVVPASASWRWSGLSDVERGRIGAVTTITKKLIRALLRARPPASRAQEGL